jgi:hypothetical protein
MPPPRGKAIKFVKSCEQCNPADAEIPFDHLLDRVTGSDPSVTDYILAEPARCPRCKGAVMEKTLVEWNPEGGRSGEGPQLAPSCGILIA